MMSMKLLNVGHLVVLNVVYVHMFVQVISMLRKMYVRQNV